MPEIHVDDPEGQKILDMGSNIKILGREQINDLEAILAVSNTDVNATIHEVESHYDTIFTWDYEKGAHPKLNRLYEKAKTSMWNGETDLPWDTEVDRSCRSSPTP